MKIKEIFESSMTRKDPSYYGFDDVMDIYLKMQMLYSSDIENENDYNELENLKALYQKTDQEVRREVELTHQNSSDPDMGQADRY